MGLRVALKRVVRVLPSQMGVLKGLAVNKRAAQIASACGLDVESPFLGDVYIGRVVVNPSPMRNGSFALEELASSSVWMRSAPSENAQYQMAMAEYEKAAKAKTAEAKGRVTEDGSAGGTGSSGSGGGTGSEGGAMTPGSYKWAQTSDDLEVTVALPPGTAKRDVSVAVAARSLTVGLKGGAPPPLVSLSLMAAVRPDEMTWTFGAAASEHALPQVQIMVEKADGVTWNRLEAATEGQIL